MIRGFYTISEAANAIGRSRMTVRRWYLAQDYAAKIGHHFPLHLPPRKLVDTRGTWGFTADDIEELKVFRDSVQRSDLAFYNKGFVYGNSDKLRIRQERKDFLNELMDSIPSAEDTLKMIGVKRK